MAAIDRKTLLSDDAIETAVSGLGDGELWRRDGDRLRATFEFDDFVAAFGFMTSVALVAENLFHHPEWSNVYGRVEVAVTNHDAGGLTELDLEFCRRVTAIARR